MAIYHDPEFKEENPDVEVAIPIEGALPADTPAQARELPGGDMACVVLARRAAWKALNGVRVFLMGAAVMALALIGFALHLISALSGIYMWCSWWGPSLPPPAPGGTKGESPCLSSGWNITRSGSWARIVSACICRINCGTRLYGLRARDCPRPLPRLMRQALLFCYPGRSLIPLRRKGELFQVTKGGNFAWSASLKASPCTTRSTGPGGPW
ncbi:MAG: hypothetical protein ACM3TT_02535 [Syntrophothermus sp.]